MQNWELKPAHDIQLPIGEQIKSTRREGGLPSACMSLLFSAITSSYLATYHRLTIQGRENLPIDSSFVLVANHCSHLDALALASAVPWGMKSRVFPVAAGDTFFSTPLRGICASLMVNALPVWRSKACGHGLHELRERLLEDRCALIIFPEGTRSRTGEIGHFKAGIGMLVASTSVPVVPCWIDGAFRALPAKARVPRPGKLRMRVGEALKFEKVGDQREGWEDVARQLENAVRALGR